MWRALVETFHVPPTEWMMAWLFGISATVPSWAATGCFAGVRAADVRPDIAATTKPTLLLHGVHDVFVSIEGARALAAQHEQVRLVEFAQSGHAPFLEERASFNRELRVFCAVESA